MGCRRRAKTDRELKADITKRLQSICYKANSCTDCILGASDEPNCAQAYITYLLGLKEEEPSKPDINEQDDRLTTAYNKILAILEETKCDIVVDEGMGLVLTLEESPDIGIIIKKQNSL